MAPNNSPKIVLFASAHGSYEAFLASICQIFLNVDYFINHLPCIFHSSWFFAHLFEILVLTPTHLKAGIVVQNGR